jgi:glycosyltransferase involved in cell wall biosynthesis
MRVGLIVYESLEQTSGGYLYDRKLAQYLRAAGHEVVVFPQPERPYPWRLLDAFDRPFWQRLADADLDVLVQDELNHASLALGNRWLRRHADYPVVAIVHHLRASEPGSRLARWASRQVEAAFLSTVDAVILNSRTTHRNVRGLLKKPNQIPTVVARPSGRRFGTPLTADDVAERGHTGDLRILFLGNVIPRKRLHLLLAGLSRLPADGWTLDVAGSLTAHGRYARRIRRDVAALPDPTQVRLHGRVDDTTLQSLLRSAHTLAVPSAYEGYGIVYLEAMGHGLPVLASPHGGVCEIVSDGDTGSFVETAADVHETLRQWMMDRDRLVSMGQAALEAYLRSPTWQETGDRITAFLERLVANGQDERNRRSTDASGAPGSG